MPLIPVRSYLQLLPDSSVLRYRNKIDKVRAKRGTHMYRFVYELLDPPVDAIIMAKEAVEGYTTKLEPSNNSSHNVNVIWQRWKEYPIGPYDASKTNAVQLVELYFDAHDVMPGVALTMASLMDRFKLGKLDESVTEIFIAGMQSALGSLLACLIQQKAFDDKTFTTSDSTEQVKVRQAHLERLKQPRQLPTSSPPDAQPQPDPPVILQQQPVIQTPGSALPTAQRPLDRPEPAPLPITLEPPVTHRPRIFSDPPTCPSPRPSACGSHHSPMTHTMLHHRLHHTSHTTCLIIGTITSPSLQPSQ